MTEKQLHEKAIRLIEGGRVEVDGLVVRAVKVPFGFDACNECDMDCLCKGDMAALCSEIDWIYDSRFLLKLC